MRRRGVAQALDELLGQAERGAVQGNAARVAERLHHFGAYANHHARKHIDAPTEGSFLLD